MTETAGRLTPAQIKAKAWIPVDGSWRSKPGRLTAALNSLSTAWPGALECEWAACGPRAGMQHRWRLTPHGVHVMEVVTNA
jgi:hypothetical protein